MILQIKKGCFLFSISTSLLKANHIGIRNLKGQLSKDTLKNILVITDFFIKSTFSKTSGIFFDVDSDRIN